MNKSTKRKQPFGGQFDVLSDRFQKPAVLEEAKKLLSEADQSEEAFLGAQAVMLLHGLI
ncbi:MAG: hypothetical protein K2X01_02025 [Cyanobacteria bacterium]|nr:hypothetical protein [Cyanobacteriota bacterium]